MESRALPRTGCEEEDKNDEESYNEMHPRWGRGKAAVSASAVLISDVVVLSFTSTMRVASPGWAQKKYQEAKGKTKEEDKEEKK